MRNDWREESLLEDRSCRPRERDEHSSVDPQYEDWRLPDLDEVVRDAS